MFSNASQNVAARSDVQISKIVAIKRFSLLFVAEGLFRDTRFNAATRCFLAHSLETHKPASLQLLKPCEAAQWKQSQ